MRNKYLDFAAAWFLFWGFVLAGADGPIFYLVLTVTFSIGCIGVGLAIFFHDERKRKDFQWIHR